MRTRYLQKFNKQNTYIFKLIFFLLFFLKMQLEALMTLLIIIIINLAVGILPHVDNFAHLGGFLSGFLAGFILFVRPQFSWMNQRHVPPGYFTSVPAKSKYKTYQLILLIIALLLLVAG